VKIFLTRRGFNLNYGNSWRRVFTIGIYDEIIAIGGFSTAMFGILVMINGITKFVNIQITSRKKG